MTYTILDTQLSSAIFGGFGSLDVISQFTQDFKNATQDLATTAKYLWNSATKKVMEWSKPGLDFFQQWWKDDLVGATAGTIAGVLTLGVVVVVGGQVLGAMSGGLAALRGLKIMQVIRGTAIALTAAGALGTLIRFAVRGVQFAYNFNWNITDSQIRQQQKALIDGLYGQFGEAAGTALASLLCGFAPVKIIERANVVKVNPSQHDRIKEISEFDPQSDSYGELYEEMMESLRALIASGGRVAAQYLFLESYKNIRKFLKDAFLMTGIDKLFPGLGKMVKNWGAEGSKPWSFASAVEDWVESIDDQRIQNFTEEFIESFMDTCTENVMVISYIF